MENIFEKVWVYCGHESQIPNSGDYYALTIGRRRQMAGAADGSIHVRMHNRCPHRGVQLVGNLKGNTGGAFVCSYHAWSFHLDGKVRAIPLARGYEGTATNKSNPDCNVMARRGSMPIAASSFASLGAVGPTLDEFLGDARIAFDDMCDRSPQGEAEVVPYCHRMVQQSNWKFFMENQLDALHPSVTHQSTGISAGRVEKRIKEKRRLGAAAPSLPARPSRRASSSGTACRRSISPRGHGILKAYMALRPQDPDTLEYEALLGEIGVRRGEDRGVFVAQHPPRAGLSLPVGAVALAAAALPAPHLAGQDALGDLGTSG